MTRKGLLLLTVLSSYVLSLPVTSSQLENEDVKVMKCIVEVLTDVLSRPHLMPVSQECLVTLKTDDRLVKILRHHKFLKELQDIAVRGDHERAELQRDIGTPTPVTQATHTADTIADRSMLEALGGPGERSILSQERRTGTGDGKEEDDDNSNAGEQRGDNGAQRVQMNRGNERSSGSHASDSVDKWSKAKAERREEEEGEEASEEKQANSDDSEEGRFVKDEQGGESEEKRDAHQNKEENKTNEEAEEEKDLKSAIFSHKHKNREEEEQEVKRGSRESLKHWTKRAKSLSLKRKAAGKEAQQEVAHHSKEIMEEDEGEEKRDIQRSPEEKELQMIARRTPEERRVLEEEGSASRKSEEPEIESLAAIESELESVAQKLHDLRRG